MPPPASGAGRAPAPAGRASILKNSCVAGLLFPFRILLDHHPLSATYGIIAAVAYTVVKGCS